jgi:hypothetical protein
MNNDLLVITFILKCMLFLLTVCVLGIIISSVSSHRNRDVPTQDSKPKPKPEALPLKQYNFYGRVIVTHDHPRSSKQVDDSFFI